MQEQCLNAHAFHCIFCDVHNIQGGVQLTKVEWVDGVGGSRHLSMEHTAAAENRFYSAVVTLLVVTSTG